MYISDFESTNIPMYNTYVVLFSFFILWLKGESNKFHMRGNFLRCLKTTEISLITDVITLNDIKFVSLTVDAVNIFLFH